jgi:DNA-binding NtrC family response regulator/tetratricopeptide (TPR) repeat protein
MAPAGEKDRAVELDRLTKLPEPTTDDFREMFRLALEMAEAAPVEAENWFKAIAATAERVRHAKALCIAHLRLSERAVDRADYTAARDLADRVLAYSRTYRELHLEASYNFLLGRIAEQTGQFDEAATCYQLCADIGRECKHQETEHRGLNQLGNLYLLCGDAVRALECYRAAQAVPDPKATELSRAVDLNNTAIALVALGRWEEATESLYRALAIAEELGREDVGLSTWALVMNQLGELALRRDNVEKAVGLLEQVKAAAERHPVALDINVTETHALLGDARLRSGDLAAAEVEYNAGLKIARRTVNQLQVAQLQRRLAELDLVRERLDDGLGHAGASVVIAESIGARSEYGNALRVQALLQAAGGRDAEARASFEKALVELAQLPNSFERALARFHYGRFLREMGEGQSAAEHLSAAAESFRHLSVVREAEEINHLLMEDSRAADANVALVRAVANLSALGLAPARMVEQALKLVCESAGFDAAALLLDGREAARHGRTGSTDRAELAGDTDYAVTPNSVGIRFGTAAGIRAELHLERRVPNPAGENRLLLEAACNLLVPALRELAAAPEAVAAGKGEIAGLRYPGVIGPNKAMHEVLVQVARFAPAPVSVLVCGESGTGKELIARALHDSGPRSAGPFVAINCAAVPENLLEAELYGIEKGTATGVSGRKGKFELAHGGTAFLDEIGDMSPNLQAKLLRFLQDKAYERVGGRERLESDVRLVAATNQDLVKLIESGGFRRDLYYRLNGVELALPPLRERIDDIPTLAVHFVARANTEFGRKVTGVSPEAMNRLVLHRWPGNVRELAHVIERAVVLACGRLIEVGDLPPALQPSAAPAASGVTVRELRRRKAAEAPEGERERLLEALQACKGNATEAARAVGYSRAQFYRLLRKHGITPGKAG